MSQVETTLMTSFTSKKMLLHITTSSSAPIPQHLLQRWIGRTTAEDHSLFRWPPSSPDITPCGFSLRLYIQDSVFLPPIPEDASELRRGIIAVVSEIDCDRLQRVWAQMDCRLDVCRVTNGGRIQHLRRRQKESWRGTWRVYLSIRRSRVTIPSAIKVH